MNDEAYTLVKQYPDKIQAMATVPLNDVQLAVAEELDVLIFVHPL